jgi:carbonic anhydrase
VIPPDALFPPATNWKGLRDHWRNDLIAGLSVALVALPLALGIATAAGAPPISGLVSSIVAGLFTTFVRGSKVAINGPGNSLIVILAAGFAAFGGEAEAFPHLLGAIVVAGAVQVAFGLLRLGKLGNMIPAAVIQAMLAAIGLIIISKQAHVLFGHEPAAGSPLATIENLSGSIADFNPAATVIGVLSLLIMIIHPQIKAKVIHFVPAPLWVVIFAIPIAYLFEHHSAALLALTGRAYHLDEGMLIAIPDDLLGSLVLPDFSLIREPSFWRVVATLSLVTSIENIVSVKAVDKLDYYRRQSNLNRDLIAMGLSTIGSAFLGGLPVLTVIARSSVNVNHGAKTGWSNFAHGAVILFLILLLPAVIQEIALAALAGILIYTGWKLTAPNVVEDTLRKGPDYFLVFLITTAATLLWGLLWGILVGLAAELASHLLILGISPREAWRHIRETSVETMRRKDEPWHFRVRGVATFLNIPRLHQALEQVNEGEPIIVDFSPAMLADNTLLEYCHERSRRYQRDHGDSSFDVIGLEAHRALSDHPDALHALERKYQARRLTPRQKSILRLTEERGWSFDPRRDWDPDHLDDFHFFRVHLIEFRDSVVQGGFSLSCGQVNLSLSDVTFDEGPLVGQVYHTTTLKLSLPFQIPVFVLEREGVLDRALELAGFQDIDFRHFTRFSKRFVLKGPDELAIRRFMGANLLEFFEREQVYHIESSGSALVLFKTFMRRATASEIREMVAFSERLVPLMAAQTT